MCSAPCTPGISIGDGFNCWTSVCDFVFLVWVRLLRASWFLPRLTVSIGGRHSLVSHSGRRSCPEFLLDSLSAGYSYVLKYLSRCGLCAALTIMALQLSLFNYIIDAYLSVAASAIAASIIFRSISGAAFPVCWLMTCVAYDNWLLLVRCSCSQSRCTINWILGGPPHF